MEEKKRATRYPEEFRRRGIRLFSEHRGDYGSDFAAYKAISSKLGCHADTLRGWCVQATIDAGQQGGVTSDEKARLKALERENRELRQANEILRKASAYFAMAELDRPASKSPRKW